MQRVYVHTLGCEKNQADSGGMRFLLKRAGLEAVDDPSEAEAIVINTCGFIAPAIEESVAAIVDACDAKAEGEVQKVVAVGCLVSRSYGELKEALPEVDVFLGTANYHSIVHALQGQISDKIEVKNYVFEMPSTTFEDKPYAWSKIAEGCSRNCSFCTIPSFRGQSTSKSPDAIIEDLKQLADQGVQEAILVSQDSTQYGRDLSSDIDLLALLERIETEPNVPPWVRLHYTFPDKIFAPLLAFLEQSKRICNYIDIPLQHTDPTILKAMRRPPNTRDVIAQIASYANLWKRTTVIVGHPGESDDTVEYLLADLREGGFDNVSVFPWSAEDGTHASTLTQPAPSDIERWQLEMSNDLAEILHDHRLARLGQTHRVLIDSIENDIAYCRTTGQSPEVDNLTIVEGSKLKVGDFIDVVLDEIVGVDFGASRQKKLGEFVIDSGGRLL